MGFFPSFLPGKQLLSLSADRGDGDCGLGVALCLYVRDLWTLLLFSWDFSGMYFRGIQLSLGFYNQGSMRDEFKPWEAAPRRGLSQRHTGNPCCRVDLFLHQSVCVGID